MGLDYGPQAAAWQAGRIDALFSEDSAWGAIEAAGLQFRFIPRPRGFPKIGGLMVGAKRDFIDRNRKAIEGFGRTSCKGTVDWSGRNSAGHVVASGIYVLRLEVDGKVVSTQKVVVVR